MERVCKICSETKQDTEFTSKRSDASCKECRRLKALKVSQDRQQRLRSSGLCTRCGKKESINKNFCEECRIIDRTQRNKITDNLKIQCVEYKGGKCEDCGILSNHYEIYDFHHLDPKLKDRKVSDMIHKQRNLERIKIELDKCVLLCSNCHRIRHGEERG